MTAHESRPLDAVAYVLGELDEAETARARAAERNDASFRAEVEELRPAVDALRSLPAEAWDPVDPPPLQLPTAEAGDPVDPPRPQVPGAHVAAIADHPRRRLSLRPLAAVAAAVVLFAAGAGLGALVADRDDGAAPGPEIALRPLDGGDPRQAAAVRLSSDGDGEAELDIERLPPTDDDDFYELWLLNSPDDLVSVASFRVPRDGRTTLTVPLPVDVDRYQFFDVSREPVDGDPSHSSESVLRGRTA